MEIIIDGYNLLLVRGAAMLFPGESLEERRAAMVVLLGTYAGAGKHRVTVVFDSSAVGLPGPRVSTPAGVTVAYCGPGYPADRKVVDIAAGRANAVVVSSDREVTAAARRAGRDSIPSEDFLTRLMLSLSGDPGEREETARRGTKKKGPSSRLTKEGRKKRRLFGRLS